MVNTKPKIVLYNPPAAHFTMPLSLIAIGSALDRSEFDVRLIDARLDRNALETLVDEARDALCVGITVLTGEPILGAIQATRALREALPGTTIVWGGWHPSLFPRQCIEEGGADVAVSGQGEVTFREIVERLASGGDLHGCRGCTHNLVGGAHPTSYDRHRLKTGATCETPRDLADLQTLPPHDYSLIDPERYFAAKSRRPMSPSAGACRRRQLDYVSSLGCPFRCAFCADPQVFGRRWTGVSATRIVSEITDLYRQYRFDDVAFQDETFFTRSSRVAEMCEGFLKKGLRLTWTATMRADQGARLDEDIWSLARRSGLRRVLVGVESGDPDMLVQIQKDITLEQVDVTAERCRRLGIMGVFPFIVGLPGETDETVEATFACARRLREISPDFELHVFFYKPYPGNPLAAKLAESGYALPATLEEWARLDFVDGPTPWIEPKLRRKVDAFRFYQRTGFACGPWWRAPQRAIARLRCRRGRFELPIEKVLAEWFRPPREAT